MALSWNLLAGIANSAWSALIALAVVPLYLRYLGIEAYGLIGFFVTTQALLAALDFGLTPTINREVARCSASGNIREAGSLLHTLAVIYWAMGALIALLLAMLSPLVAQYWLQSRQLPAETINHAVILMGLIIGCRWPVGLYQGALMGAQRLGVASSIGIAMTTLGNLGAVAIVVWVSPTIEAFFIWQGCVALVHVAAMRLAAWHVVGRSGDARFDPEQLKRIWRFSMGMGVVGLIALVFTQLDKVILSKMLGLEEFGRYMLATLVVSALAILVTPVFNVVYPRFSALVAAGDEQKLATFYRLATRMLATVLFPMAMLLAVFGNDLMRIWTGNPGLAGSVAPVISLLAIGSALHGVMYLPYALQLAYGMTRLPLVICIVLMVAYLPLVYFLVVPFGVIGGALAWLCLHVLYMLLGTWLTHRDLLKGIAWRWLLLDVGIPLALTVCAGLIAQYAVQGSGGAVFVKLAAGIFLAFAASALSVAISPQMRDAARNALGWGGRAR